MARAMSDISPLLVPPPTTMGLRYGQATVLEWDNNTFENSIEFRGVTLTNVPVLSSVVALTLRPGDIVGLLGWSPTGGMGSWWVIGKLVLPGSQQFLSLRGGDLILRDESNFFSIDDSINRLVTIQDGAIFFGRSSPFESFAQILGQNLDLNILADANMNIIGGNQLWLEAGPGSIFLFSDNAVAIGTPSNRIGGTISMRGSSFIDLSTNGASVFLVSDNNDATLGAGGNIFVNTTNQLNLATSSSNVWIGHDDQPAAANAHITAGGFVVRDSSSRRIKVDITDYHTDPAKVLNLRPRTFRGRKDVEANPDSQRWHVGLVAEELDELGLGDFVGYDEEGLPESIHYDRLSIALLEVLKLQQRQIDWLATRVSALTEMQPGLATMPEPFPITADVDETVLPKLTPIPTSAPVPPERPPEQERETPEPVRADIDLTKSPQIRRLRENNPERK